MNLFETRRAWRTAEKAANAISKPFGLSTADYLLLEQIEAGPLPMNVIAKNLETSMAFITNMVKPLRERGWVRTSKTHKDARVNLVELIRHDEFTKLKTALQNLTPNDKE